MPFSFITGMLLSLTPPNTIDNVKETQNQFQKGYNKK